jgi:hypothetical protein
MTARRTLWLALLLACCCGAAAERPPRNPFLADSVYPLGHGDSGQQDALDVAGPSDLAEALAADEIQYEHTGPGQFGAYTSSPYPDGRRVIWRLRTIRFHSYSLYKESDGR